MLPHTTSPIGKWRNKCASPQQNERKVLPQNQNSAFRCAVFYDSERKIALWKFSGDKIIGCHFSPSEMAYCAKHHASSRSERSLVPVDEQERASETVGCGNKACAQKSIPISYSELQHGSFSLSHTTTTDPLRGSYHCHISPHAALTGVSLHGVSHNKPSPTAGCGGILPCPTKISTERKKQL